jgi:hypothetical protein
MTMRRVDGPAAHQLISWLEPTAPIIGFDVDGWADSTWVLHAMFERDGAPDVTHQQARQHEIAAGRDNPLVVDGVDLEAGSVATGIPLGFVEAPGPPWRRLRWAELTRREGLELGADMAWPPSDRWFPFASWPIRILPPPEGSLDESSLMVLIRILLEHSRAEAIRDCVAFFGSVATGEFDELIVYAGELAHLRSLVAERGMTPTNVWPTDHSWLLHTDWDLMATRVGGSVELIAAIEADDDLETLRWQPSTAS